MIYHDLKCINPHFRTTWYGHKPWEIRKNDRNYALGDYVRLKEYDPETDDFSGRVIVGKIAHLFHAHIHPGMGLQDDHCIFTLDGIECFGP